MTQIFQTNITVMQDADGTKEIFTVHTENGKKVLTMAEYIKNPISGKLRGVTYEDGKIIDVHIRDTDDVVKVFVPVRHGRWIGGDPYCPICKKDKFRGLDADIWADWQPPYCPNCGAKMDGGAD